MIPASTNQLFSAGTGYQISRSVRLRSSASAYFSRTISTASTSTTVFTWSGWVKRGSLAASRMTIAYHGNTGATGGLINLEFNSDSTIRCFFDGTNTIQTTAVYRDPSAWYHIMLAYDSTQATASNRAKLYVNGVQVTAFLTANYPPLNQAINAGSGNIQQLGLVSTSQFDGYLTEINFIDGQALTPSSFGETDIFTGVWKPKKYVGTYGTNGFYLNFSDPSAATAAAIGADRSGNGNNCTPNNISVTAGVTYDSMLDVPTPWPDGGNGRGNYAVLNPLTYGGTIDNGNLEIVTLVSYASARAGTSTIAADGGKFYWEATKLSGSSTDLSIGVCTDANSIAGSGNRFYYDATGDYIQNGSVVSAAPATYATNDIIGLAVDTTTSTIEFFKNGVSQGSYTMSFAGPYFAQVLDNTGTLQARFAINFGQRPFSYTPPSGFKALNTQNLPEPTILKGNQYFDVSLWTGDGTGSRVITTNLNFSPDFVWAKSRSSATWSNVLGDTVRGIGNLLVSNSTTAEVSSASSVAGYISALSATSFTATQGSSNNGNYNFSGVTYVGWQWKEGATQGFDIVTYTGNNVAGRTISHSLGVAPSLIIIKNRGSIGTAEWLVGHSSIGWGSFLLLNSTAASTVASNRWNNTAPTSSVFTLGTIPNSNTETYVAYLFAEVAGFSRFGSYTGNGSTDGTFVFLGFRPRWILIKRTDSAGYSWLLHDTARSPENPSDELLVPNTSSAESTAAAQNIDFVSNGFKLRTSDAFYNANGGTYIFAAFAEVPFRNALAR